MAEREPVSVDASSSVKCAGCSKQLLHRTVCRRCQTPYCGPGCAKRHESAHSLVCKKIAQGIRDEVAAPWPPSTGAKVEYEFNGRWFPGSISKASPTTLYFRYAARCYKQYEEPIERGSMERLRPQRRLRRGNVLLHGWPAAAVELLSRRLPEPLAFAVAGYACGRVREFRLPDGHHVPSRMECPALTPDGRCLVVATTKPDSDEFFVKFYSLESGECVRTLKNDMDDPENDIKHLAEAAAWVTVFFPEGGPWQSCKVWLAVVYFNFDGPEPCEVVDLETNEVVSEVGDDVDHFCQIYASSKTQAYAVTVHGQNGYKIVDLATSGVIRSGELRTPLPYDEEEICMRASPDGSHALLMHTHERASVESWSLGAQGTGHRLEQPDAEPDPSLPLTAGALVVDIDSGRKGDIVGQGFKGGKLFSWNVKFSGDNSVQSWGPLDCAKSLRVIPENTVKKLCPTNGAHITLTERQLRLWDRTTGQCTRTLSHPPHDDYHYFADVCATPDGARAVTASRKTKEGTTDVLFLVWDLRTGERASSLQLTGVKQRGVTPWEYAVAMDITPDGNWLVVRSEGSYGVYWI